MTAISVNGVTLEVDSANVDGFTVVRGEFGRKSRRCVKGFGICKVKIFPKPKIEDIGDLDAFGEGLAREIAAPHEHFTAAFTLDERQSTLEIRFLEPIPHFEADFYVDEGYPGVERMLRGACGYEQILPTLGHYQVQIQPGAPYGVVTLDVLRGRKLMGA